MTNIANPRAETLYGFPQPNQRMNPLPIIANRAPRTTDVGYPIGQPWIYKNNGGYELIGVSQGIANWQATSGSGSVVSIAGTANQITVTNSSGSVTLSFPSAITAPGSILATTSVASTTTMTAGTGLTATTGNIVATAGAVNAGTSMTATSGNITATNGNLVLGTAGNKLVYSSVASTTTAGANSAGRVTLVAGTATVSTTAVTANSLIRLTRQSIGSTGAAALGLLSVGTISAGVSFIISALNPANATALATTDVSEIFWEIVN